MTDITGRKKFAVLASGSGTNFQVLIDSVESGYIPAKLELLISDNPSAYALKRAKKADIDTRLIYPQRYSTRKEMEQGMVQELKDRGVEYIVLAGYMRLLTPYFIGEFRNRVLNVHPSLLPAFPGTSAIEEALEYGVKISGVTVHFVDEGLDTGPILMQRPVRVFENDTLDSLRGRIQKREWQILPRVTRALVSNKFKKLEERKWVIIDE